MAQNSACAQRAIVSPCNETTMQPPIETDHANQAELDRFFMQRALELAQQAEQQGEIPVGAVLVHQGQIIAEGANASIALHDPTAHAEIQAMRQAGLWAQNYRLLDTTLYVTLEPCPMCAGALVHARVQRLVFGASDPRTGSCGSLQNLVQDARLNHQLEVTSGVCADEAAEILRRFFRMRRAQQKAQKQPQADTNPSAED